ncbi:hypothetical protein SAMN02745163_02517 [Clostridium cavendishii DSM 21758]|uniref:Uncharacterized protein n=1 Tax=Clostridium cavendishii DSM 21758 TaxID=1121302 RepID=A0A1M6LWF9_9CLOT|nr:hypothetical protein [Clostridium cavendishii]SHJ75491.1 hypothetical protein SAMN02745163_02517 [Clostridium cavendishii DSM 21758]
MNEELVKLLNEYKETERCMEMGMNWLNEKEYAKGKLDIVKTIIADLERLSQKV